MKKVLISIVSLFAVCVMLTGCWSQGASYPKSSIDGIYTKTNERDYYNITLNLKKSLKYAYNENGAISSELIYNVKDAKLKKVKAETSGGTTYTKLGITGKFEEKKLNDKAAISHDFNIYSNDKYVFEVVDGKERKKEEVKDSNYISKSTSIIPSSFYANEKYMDRVFEYEKVAGDKQYAVEYLMINDEDTENPIYPIWTLFSTYGFTSSHASGSTYKVEKSLMRVFLNSEGIVTKQLIELKFTILGKKVDGLPVTGTANFSLERNYKW